MVFSINKLFHLFTYKARNEASDQYEVSRNTMKWVFCGAQLFSWSVLTSLCCDHCVKASKPDTQIIAAVQQGGVWTHRVYSLFPVLLAGEFGKSWPLLGLWVHLRICLFFPYYTGCLQPSCVVFSATALAFEFGGQLALSRAYPLPDPPQSPVCSCMHTLGHTLVSLSSCQVCSVCVWG